MSIHGLYEQIISQLVQDKLDSIDDQFYYVKKNEVTDGNSTRILSQHLTSILQKSLQSFKGKEAVLKRIEFVNKLLKVIADETLHKDVYEERIKIEAKVLSAIISKVNYKLSDYDDYIKEITPFHGLSYSELFTGQNSGISFESEIRKEIKSSDEICFLVSFIKFSAIAILRKELEEFTERGGKIRIITTTYTGATEAKAIEYLSKLPNSKIKISYNTRVDRLHAKAYLFVRKTKFDTGYIGSSNLSKSAITHGLEWNIKITRSEIPQIIDQFAKTFESYWSNPDFELFEVSKDSDRLRSALKKEKIGNFDNQLVFFDIRPFPFQEEILEKLLTERNVHKRFRNLIVAATGTGKTVISAFDFKNFLSQKSGIKFLYIAHRKEILEQARSTFRGILRDNNFGELWVDGIEPSEFKNVFASISTINNRIDELHFDKQYFEYIIVDEVHHISAPSYRKLINFFEPQVLLGLTATPERMDGLSILKDFSNTIAAEIRLPEALNRKILCPFQYFGITDSVDISQVSWRNGRYDVNELSVLYTENDRRVAEIITNLDKYLNDKNEVTALGFCTSQIHAEYMARKFNEFGIKSEYLVSSNSSNRHQIRKKLANKEINYLFVVDIFNEGVDIPEIDTVLFLRPTESLTVFLQQLGRGLRHSKDKEFLSVLDFVGNSRSEYDYEGKFRALVGKTNQSIIEDLENDFPFLPLGCSIVLEKQAKQYILENIKKALIFSKNELVRKIQDFRNHTGQEITLENFTAYYKIPLQKIYARGCWNRLLKNAEVIESFDSTNEVEITRAILKKWLSCNSYSYFQFIDKLAANNFDIEVDHLSNLERQYCLLLYYDIWQEPSKFVSLEAGIRAIGINPLLVGEIREIIDILINKIDYVETEIDLPFEQPLKLHSRYTRDQVLAAFGLHSFHQKSSNREGVAESKELNTEILFVTLDKTEKYFSPTTLFEVYAINMDHFHWQTQNVVSPDSNKGKKYINHKIEGRKILLFIRERNQDEYGNTMGSVFLGECEYIEHTGSKPMSIVWKLKKPMPAFLWKPAAKLSVG
ncbi:DUF3427 domain-containing protein [Leptospira sp. GIMC2001]|uniref:DUF3427 domain-containing protein n=1 Tax=Leptospira sp. GIMC2001 TaxID=1513297 RepID=UPI00234B2C3D|nr:DUF3427 domain-containing protein [Leptospira sp. GIMC2001]WCL49689.1 DUF3427 domain-containing protein [Leptospira sp. GIMC2001]